MALLSIRNVTRRFGGIVAIDDVSLDVEQGQLVGLIGPNGAGKTTLFNVVTRLYRPDSGRLEFEGKSLLRTSYMATHTDQDLDQVLGAFKRVGEQLRILG